ncbi:MAG: hypothetical protein IPH53_16450 [Flavobacteriales bacterium]|nr:hypothetical protein [Flavobacteriales bacterium]
MKTILKLDGKEFPLLQLSYSLQRQTDHNGKPAEDVRGAACISAWRVRTTPFAQWMTSPFTRKNGEHRMDRQQGQPAEVHQFTDAHCVGYSESFNSTDSKPMIENVVVSARKLEIGDAKHESYPDK